MLLQGFAAAVCAQATPPNAGDVLRNTTIRSPLPPVASPSPLDSSILTPKVTATGGPSVLVRDIQLDGNTVFTDQELKAVVADGLGVMLDLAGMKALARRISDHYRKNGYQFARAAVRAQEFKDGVLRLTVLEGRYGKIRLTGEPELVAGATPYFASLQPQGLIESHQLERTMLIFDGNPGLSVVPSASPGVTPGTSDLDVLIRMQTIQGGDVGVDNAGSRYTGYYRAHVSWYHNSLAAFGDRAMAMLMVTDQSMVLGSLDYERPWGAEGIRWRVGYSRTSYALAEEFASLDASGLANVWSIGLSYPLVRSQATNLTLTAGVQHKDLRDEFAAVSLNQEKNTWSVPLALRYDHHDGLFGGAVSYGSLTGTVGRLSMDDALTSTDEATARRAGSYGKLDFDIARIQSFTPALSAYARFSSQWASGNLDSSERLAVGGFEGVRAYPVGEGAGDAGWIAQAELRYVVGDFAPYLFYDASHTRINQSPWDAASDQSHNLSGAGVGVRYLHDLWSGNLSISWRADGGRPTQDVGDINYRIAFALNRNF
jgi:hemolysin activation/secretion protein